MSDRDIFGDLWPSSFGWSNDPHGSHAYGHHDPHDVRDARNFAAQLVEILRAHHAFDLEWALRAVVGHDALSLGVSAGLVSKLKRNAAGVVDLVRVLAEVHEHYFAHAGHFYAALPYAAGRSLGRAAVRAVDDAFGLRHTSEDAHKQRDAILAALDRLLTDPLAVAECFAEAERADYVSVVAVDERHATSIRCCSGGPRPGSRALGSLSEASVTREGTAWQRLNA